MKLATLIIMKSAPLILVMKMLMRLKKFDDDQDKKGHTDDNDSVDDDAATLSSETEWSGDVDVADGHIFDEKRARMSLAKLFCTQAWPPQRVESKYFKQILKILNPQFQISKHTFRNDCLEFFEEEKAKINKLGLT